MKNISLFTSESVCAGHPDKLCDQISDAIVDAVLTKDPHGRVAVETVATYDRLMIVGEVSASASVNYERIARKQIKRLGYTMPVLHFSDASPIDVFIHTQSPEIAVGVENLGAGDQGMMFGFACQDTSSYMPMPITLAHSLVQAIDNARESKVLSYLRPDGKSQVTVRYENLKPVGIEKVVLAVPHEESVSLGELKADLYKAVIVPVLEEFSFAINEKDVTINGTGVWHMSGPASDSGVTGRKIVVDTYGGFARVGGGCFSGKDPSKVDRSGAYAARFLAKNIVAHGLSGKAEVSLAYAIGVRKPLMQEVETFGTEKTSKKAINDFIEKLLDTSVQGIIKTLDLRRPLYTPTAAYGHFGRGGFPWEVIVK